MGKSIADKRTQIVMQDNCGFVTGLIPKVISLDLSLHLRVEVQCIFNVPIRILVMADALHSSV